MNKAHPNDVLLVASLSERMEHRQFEQRQIITLDRSLRLLEGRKVRRIWMTSPARVAVWPCGLGAHLNGMATKTGATVHDIVTWTPEPPSLIELIEALPEQNATTGRDFGRGYAKAIKDVIALISLTALETAS